MAFVIAADQDELRRLVRQLLSDTEAVRDTAVAAVGERSDEDRRKIGSTLLDEARRSDAGKTGYIVLGLIAVAKASPDQASDLARGIRERMWANLTTGIAVELASSGIDEFVALARQASEDPAVPAAVKEAVQQVFAEG